MTNYNEQAKQFLESTKTTLGIEKATEQTPPIWATNEKHGIKYTVTLSNSRGSYTFPFWDSVHNREVIDAIEKAAATRTPWDRQSPEYFRAKDILKKNGATISDVEKFTPDAYDILACLDVLHEDTFEDFCSSFGYDVDSRQALKIFKAAEKQDRALRKLFTLEELDLLQDIV